MINDRASYSGTSGRHSRAMMIATFSVTLVMAIIGSALSSAPSFAGAEAPKTFVLAASERTKQLQKTRHPLHKAGTVDATGSECLIGGSAVSSGCVVTSQQPVLQIPGSGNGNVYIVDDSSPNQNNAWVSPQITLSPSGNCGGNTCYTVPPSADLLPRQSYQWAFIPSGGSTDLTWQGFTIDYVRAGKEPTDNFGPLTIGLASGTVQTMVQTQPVKTASGTVQIGLSHRGLYNGTPTGEPWFVEDPAGALPIGWLFSGVDANVPWVRISAVDAVGGSGTRAVSLQAFDGSLLEFTNTNGGTGGWAPPVGVGRPANAYGSLTQSSDGNSFTWTSGTTIVSFVQSSSDDSVWLASSSQQVLPGSGNISPGLQVTWDTTGRLAAIADQSSLNGSGQATRVARFYYGGDSQCGSPSGSGLVAAPSGMLCAFENLDGSIAQVFYRALKTSFGVYQIGQVALPGGANWSFDWQTANFTLSNNTNVTAPQLVSVQTPRGYDAASASAVSSDDSKWWVVYDPFFGAFQGFVSPLPGMGPAANDRIGRYYQLASGSNPGQVGIAWANVSGSAGNFSLSQGAQVQTVGFDTAWRRTSIETLLNDTISYTVDYSWNTNLDLQTGISFAGASQTQAYDFLGRPKTLTGPGDTLVTTTYDQYNLSGWIATVYANSGFAAPGASSEAINTAAVNWNSAPAGAGSGAWSMQLSTYLPAPASGDSVVYRLTSDSNGSATLWVNGQCGPAAVTLPSRHHSHRKHRYHPRPPKPGDTTTNCGNDNTATTSAATATGDALNLVVQYVRDTTSVSSSDPVTIQVEQQVNGGAWTALTLAQLDPGLDLQSTVASSDTLSTGGSVSNLTKATAWQDALFRIQAGVTYPGLGGKLVTVPGYENTYAPTNSQWKRLTSQTSAGNSTYGLGYWGNTATPSSSACNNTTGVIQAGQIQALTYPEPGSGAAAGLSRQLVYDAAGRKAGVEILPSGAASGVVGCLTYDARGRKLNGQVNAYNSGSTGGGAMAKAWAYSADGFTTTVTHTFAQVPACAGSASSGTCTVAQTVDLLGRTVATRDLWGTTVSTDYQLAPATGISTSTATTTAGSFTATTTVTQNRDGSAATLSRTDSAGSPTLAATWSYDSFGRAGTIATQSGSAEVITATYGYDDQNRAASLTWSRAGNTVVSNALTLSPNSTRTLGEKLSLSGISY